MVMQRFFHGLEDWKVLNKILFYETIKILMLKLEFNYNTIFFISKIRTDWFKRKLFFSSSNYSYFFSIKHGKR